MSNKITINGAEMFPARYAGGDDLAGKAYTLRIERIEREKMTNPRTHQETEKHVIYFAGAKRGFVLGKEFAESIAVALGEWDAALWHGKSVQIFPQQTRLGVGVRARKAPNGITPLPAAILTADDQDEEEDDETLVAERP